MRDSTPEGGMAFKDIAKQLGISHQRVHQIYQQAMYKLAHNAQVREAATDIGITVNNSVIDQAHPFAAKRARKKK